PVPDVSKEVATSEKIGWLTRQLAVGDEAAFREFHAQYFNRLYQFLLVLVRGQEGEAQEALQLTLLRVVRYARVFESEEVFWSWLKVLARSAARDAGRKQQRYTGLLRNFTLHCQERSNPGDSCADETLRQTLEEALEGLEPLDRQLLEGKYLQGATVKELA